MLLGWQDPRLCWERQQPSTPPARTPCGRQVVHASRPPKLQPTFISPPQGPPFGRLQPSVAVTAGNGLSNDGASSKDPEPHTELGVLDPRFGRAIGLNPGLMQALMQLPGTRGSLPEAKQRALALASWRESLRKGILPKVQPGATWPQEPFRGSLLGALRNLGMPRFTRRHPALLNALLAQMLQMAHDFEAEMEAQMDKQSQQKQERPPPQQANPQAEQEGQQSGQDGQGSGDQPTEDQQDSSGNADMDPNELTQEQIEEAIKQAAQGQGQGGKELNVNLDMDMGQKQQQTQQEMSEEMAAAMQAKAEEMVQDFKEQWEPIADNLAEAMEAFDDLEGLVEGKKGFSKENQSLWRKTGWKDVAKLRRQLEKLKELRTLVNSLGRAGGRGPLRRAPEQILRTGRPPGMVRSPLQPEETRGIARSGDLSRMLPFEAHLLAAGAPRFQDGEGKRYSLRGNPSRTIGATVAASAPAVPAGAAPSATESSAEFEGDLQYFPGSRPLRMLHMARRVERTLMSYERTGWLENEPARLTGRTEIRPAAEMGPIMVCLDTSGSMMGARETVAKAVALECLRGALRQDRKCYLYAFSGMNQVQELELSLETQNMARLLEFLSHSFSGGTDVDRPLELCLQRLDQQEWAQADILMVTDGEIPDADQGIQQRLKKAGEDLGLKVHALLVGRSEDSAAIGKFCTNIHQFTAWDGVDGPKNSYSNYY